MNATLRRLRWQILLHQMWSWQVVAMEIALVADYIHTIIYLLPGDRLKVKYEAHWQVEI